MGNTWVVVAWVKDGDGYRDQEVFRGESMWHALLAARRAKKTSGCVRVEWR